jgi:hypothetical protein
MSWKKGTETPPTTPASSQVAGVQPVLIPSLSFPICAMRVAMSFEVQDQISQGKGGVRSL